MPAKRPREKHQSPTDSGTLAHIRIHGTLHRRHFPKGTPPLRIRQWLLSTETKYRQSRTARTGRFEDDARVYLEAVKAMPTFADRQRHIEEWIEVFGSRYRDSLTADEIRAQLHRWRTQPRTVTYTRRDTAKAAKTGTVTLSASAVNKRRTALMHLFSVLDGKSAPNPVRDVPKFQEPKPAPRAIPYATIRAAFATMRPSKSKARLMMIAYTGIPHTQLKALTPADVNLAARTMAVSGRKKGAGTPGRVVPVTHDGLAALKAMAKEDAWGGFSNAMLRLALRRAMAHVDPALAEVVTPYDLRHSFGTEVYRRSGDIHATQILLDSTQRRYTLGAEDPRVKKAIGRWAKRSARSSKTAKKRKRSRK